MKNTIIFSISAMFYILLLLIAFFSKRYYKSIENKIYSSLLITTFVGLLIELSGVFILTSDVYYLKYIQIKSYQIYLLTWLFLFTLYALTIFRKNKKNNYNKTFLTFVRLFYFVSIAVIFILPTEMYNRDDTIYTYGASINYVYFFSLLCILIIVINILSNIRKLFQKKYLPMLLFIFVGVLVMVIQAYYPGLLLITSAEAFITYLMYFTIENPDIKMAKDLAFSKEIAEGLRNKTVEMLNNLEDKLQGSLDEMQKFGYKNIDTRDIDVVNKELKYMQNYCINFVDEVSGLIDVSRLESGSEKICDHEYNTLKLFDDIREIVKYNGNKKNTLIDVSKKTPEKLYGDDASIKKMILYVYDYLCDVIGKDNLDIKIDTISVGNLCKLKFYFSTKKTKISDYIYDDDYVRSSRFEVNNSNIKYVKIKRQEEGSNSQIEVVNDYELLVSIKQRIIDPYVKVSDKEVNKGIRVKYFDLSSKRILILDNNNRDIKELILLLRPYKIDVDVVRMIDDMSDRLSGNKTYDMVLIDSSISYDIRKYDISLLEKIIGYKFKCIVMLAYGKEINREKYFKHGYDDYIIKPINKKNINDILIKYFKKDKAK